MLGKAWQVWVGGAVPTGRLAAGVGEKGRRRAGPGFLGSWGISWLAKQVRAVEQSLQPARAAAASGASLRQASEACGTRSRLSPLGLGRENPEKLQEEVITFNRSPGLQTDIQSRIFSLCLQRHLQTHVYGKLFPGVGDVSPDPLPCLSSEVTEILGKGSHTPRRLY